MDEVIAFKYNDVVVVSAANPLTRIKGVIKSDRPIVREEGPLWLVHWDDGDKSYWRANRLEIFKP